MRHFPTLLAPLLLWPGWAAAQDIPYAGKYAAEPEVEELARRLPELKREAGRVVAERFGLAEAEISNVVVRFADMPLDPRRDVQMAGTNTRIQEGREIQEITLNLEVHFGGQDSIERELTHEMAHAVLRNLLGEQRHRAFPKWGREGLAVWAAGQGPDRVEFWLGMMADREDPAGELLDGLENAAHSLKDYPEDFLAIAAMESLGGRDAVRRFVALLSEGSTAREAAAAVAGGTWEEFVRVSHEFGVAWIARRRPAEMVAAYRSAMEAWRGRRWDEAHRRCFALTVRWPDSWAAALGTYYGARALQMAGAHGDAVIGFSEFRSGIGFRTGLLDDALVQQAFCLEALGRGEEAVRGIDRYVRDYPFAPGVAEAAFRAAEITAVRIGDRDGARRRYERVVENWPDRPAAGKAKARLAESAVPR
ncbi:MAG: tetratricopeptide repeat protein [Candidatus Brocadiae bacterium]|nr:tetratricopeptide repeat protein [Candidatus Brocadiia bacterium]